MQFCVLLINSLICCFYFRYTGVAPAPPPGNIHSSPSEDYWAQVDLAGARQAVNLVNGVIVDGLGHVSLDSGPSNASQQPNIHQGNGILWSSKH